MAARPPSLQDLYRQRAKKPFKFPVISALEYEQQEQFGFILEKDGQILPGSIILSTENGDIIYGDKIALAE